MNIGQFITTMDDGGAETMVVELSRTLMKQGHNVKIFTFGNDHIWKLCLKHKVSHITIPSYIQKYKSIKFWPIFAWKFSRFLRDHGIQVLHSHVYKATLIGGLTTMIADIKHVATQHDVYTITDKPSRGRILKFLSKHGTKLVTISEDMQETYHDICGIPAEELHLIHNGIDTERFAPIVQFHHPHQFTFVSVGRFEPIKGFDILIKAFGKFKGNKRKVKLILVGDGSERHNLQQLANEEGLLKNIEFTGQVHNVHEIINHADCYTMASHTEGLSMSILEAMSCGLPIVVSNVGGNSELVIPGTNGFLSAPGDYIDHARKMENIYDMDIPDFKELGHNSRRIVQSRFSLDGMMCHEYVKLYRS